MIFTRVLEFAVLFFGAPTIYVLNSKPPNVLPLLLLITVGCLIVLLFDRTFERQHLWNQKALYPHLMRILTTLLFGAIFIGVWIWFCNKTLLFSLLLKRPLIWMCVMVLYPLLSVYPQELVYRTFFFHRYQKIFPNHFLMIGVNAVAFGYMHIVFQNAVAVILTLAGGFLFALTYNKTRSTFASSFEHALYGCLIFTIGLDQYFFIGTISLPRLAQKLILNFLK